MSVAAVVLLAGCGSSGKPSSGSPTSFRGQVPSTTTTTVLNNVSLRKYVKLESCGSINGGWSASGTATSPGGKEVSFKITVFFVTVPGDTVEGSGITDVSVPAGKTVPWRVTAHFGASGGMQCVLRGVG